MCGIYRINHTCSLTGKLSASIIRLINEGTSLPLLVSRPALMQCSQVNLLQQFSFISRNESKLVFRKLAVLLCLAQAFMFVAVPESDDATVIALFKYYRPSRQ